VLTPAELAVMGPDDLEDLARGRKSNGSKPARRRTTTTPARSRAAVNRTAGATDKTSGRTTRSSRRADPAS
jgi:hypothetical protein